MNPVGRERESDWRRGEERERERREREGEEGR
jgi:hypothetical protein